MIHMLVGYEAEGSSSSLLVGQKTSSWAYGYLYRTVHNIASGFINVSKTVTDLFWGTPNSLQMVIAAMKLKDAYSLEGKL